MVDDAPHESRNILELEQVPLDPLLTGFAGVILELSQHEGVFTFVEIAAGSGNIVFRISSRDENLVRGSFEREVAGYTKLARLFH
jgi:hypothetical protein